MVKWSRQWILGGGVAGLSRGVGHHILTLSVVSVVASGFRSLGNLPTHTALIPPPLTSPKNGPVCSCAYC